MKSKKLFLPTIVLIVAVLAIAVCSVVISIAKKPTVTEYDFPFSITYELDGETKTIQDIYTVHYDGNKGYNDTKTRYYVGKIGNLGDGGTIYSLKREGNTRIELATNFHADYLMGDPEFNYFDGEAFEPQIFYYDEQEVEYCDEETLVAHGVKLVSFEYPTPIENSFVFSHISIFSNVIIWPTLLIAFLAWVLTIIFVKKDKDFVRKPIDVVSTVLNYIIAFIAVPFITLYAWFLDVTGDNAHVMNQTLYFVPALTVLSIVASVALRRKGYSKSALVAEFVVPALALVCVILFAGCGGNKNTEDSSVDYSKYSFVNTSWTREAEHDTETIRFGEDGSFSYYCGCGNPVNDSDLCEGYTYDDATKTITLNCIETTDEMVKIIKIVKCDENSLHLKFDEEIRIFGK